VLGYGKPSPDRTTRQGERRILEICPSAVCSAVVARLLGLGSVMTDLYMSEKGEKGITDFRLHSYQYRVGGRGHFGLALVALYAI
jgi:hypothetical protein